MDPLVPNQVRYQAAPHSAMTFIIVRIGDCFEWPLVFLPKTLRSAFHAMRVQRNAN